MPGGYTIRKNLRLRTLILPISILLESMGGDKTPTFIGTSLNVASKVALVSVEQKKVLGSVLVLSNATDTAKLPNSQRNSTWENLSQKRPEKPRI